MTNRLSKSNPRIKLNNIPNTAVEGASSSDSDEFELTSVRVELETPRSPTLSTSPRIFPAPAARPAPTPESLQADLKDEMSYWSKRYNNDEAFRKKIDDYVEFRKELMEFKDQGVTSEDPDKNPLVPLYQKLGAMLAEAFGMVDPTTADWTPEVKSAASKGGAEYAKPSVKSFMWTQSPSILKSTINLYTRIFFGDEIASKVRHATNFVYPFVQAIISIWAAQNNGYEQSEAVQLQKRENPEWSPNVESSKIVNEDGTPGELRAMRHVLEDLRQLREMDALIKERNPIDLEQKKKQLDGQMLGARAKLLEQLTLVTKALGKSQESGTSAPLNEIEKRILDDKSPLEVRIAELSLVTTGRAAMSGLARLEAKRLLRQLKDWNMLSNELSITIDAVKAGAPYASKQVRTAVIDTDFERAKVTRYVMLNVLSNQAIVRDIRTAFYAGSTVIQVSLQLAEYFDGYEGTVASDAMQVITSLVQTLYYAWQYPDATGKDALNKFATMWQIIAMTGTGNLIGKDGAVDPTKLDRIVTGKLNTRLGAFASLLGFDQTGYMQAVLGWLVDPTTVDDDEAEKAEFEGKSIACTYAALASEFSKQKTPAARAHFVDAIAAQQLPRRFEKAEEAEQVKGKIDRNLLLYEDNVTNLANKGDASKLLSDASTLPPATQDMLRGSLELVAKSGRRTRDNDQFDRVLFKRAGKIEQLGELPSQASQKLGQAFAWFIAGTAGYLLFKSLFTLGVEAAILAGELTEEDADALATGILGGKILSNTVVLAGLVFQLGFNHGYQDYIARKALLRQNAGGGISIVNAPPPTLRGALWQEFLASLGVEDARVEEITGYETLVGKAIPKEDWPPNLKFLRKAKLTEAMWDQMFAVDVKSSWIKNFFEKNGELEGKTEEELEIAIKENLAAIRETLRTADGAGAAAEVKANAPDESDSDKGRIDFGEDVPASQVPVLNLGRVIGAGNAEPGREAEQRKQFSPRSVRARFDNIKTAGGRKEASKPSATLRRPGVGNTGESRIEHNDVPDPDHIARIDDVDHRAEYDGLIKLLEAPNKELWATKPSELRNDLLWQQHLGVYVAKTGPHVFYLAPNKHASPIKAFSIPDDERRGLLHISDSKYPSLAVGNMLQASLSNNESLGTLASEDEFAMFFYQDLHHLPTRLAEMPMQDLAAFTRHMALNHPDAKWIPMTTATVRYVPDARESIQSAGTTLPLLQPGQSFGVSYESQDGLGATLSHSVMLHYDGQQYSVVDPASNRHIDTMLDDPMMALEEFMKVIARDHPDFEPRMTFTLLYHVPQSAMPNKELLSWIRGKDVEALTAAWLETRAGTVGEARQQLAIHCQDLEAHNSYLLSVSADLAVDDKDKLSIASQVKANRAAIDLLGRVYDGMTKMDVVTPDY